MLGLGATEIWLIVGIVVVLIGVRRIPVLKAAFSKAAENFRRSVSRDAEIDVTPKVDPKSDPLPLQPHGAPDEDRDA